MTIIINQLMTDSLQTWLLHEDSHLGKKMLENVAILAFFQVVKTLFVISLLAYIGIHTS